MGDPVRPVRGAIQGRLSQIPARAGPRRRRDSWSQKRTGPGRQEGMERPHLGLVAH